MLSTVFTVLLSILSLVPSSLALPSLQARGTISQSNYDAYSEAARLVAISYCVPIQAPFECSVWCDQFPSMSLVQTFDSGLANLVGYIATDSKAKRIVIAFRGSFSLRNAIIDVLDLIPIPYAPVGGKTCSGCTVGKGFYLAWRALSVSLTPVIQGLVAQHPDYTLYITGHSLGASIAALAAVDWYDLGMRPRVITFGEPRTFNEAGAAYADARFGYSGSYTRLTHTGDPVPQVPLQITGFKHHASEVFIDDWAMPPSLSKIRTCSGAEDPNCINREVPWAPNLVTSHIMYFNLIGTCLLGA